MGQRRFGRRSPVSRRQLRKKVDLGQQYMNTLMTLVLQLGGSVVLEDDFARLLDKGMRLEVVRDSVKHGTRLTIVDEEGIPVTEDTHDPVGEDISGPGVPKREGDVGDPIREVQHLAAGDSLRSERGDSEEGAPPERREDQASGREELPEGGAG